MEQFHVPDEIEDVTPDLKTDEEYESQSDIGTYSDVFYDGDLENNSLNEQEVQSEEKLEEGEVEEEEDEVDKEEVEDFEEPDFWQLLIRSVAKEIYTKRKADGSPGHISCITDAEQMAEGKFLSCICDLLRLKYYHVKKIYNAARKDATLNIIENELERLIKQDKSIEKELQKIVWKKYRALLKKKILQNTDEFEILVCD